MGFHGDLEKFAAKTKQNFGQVTRKVMFDIDARLLERSPVGNRELWAINAPHLREWRREHGYPELVPVGYAGGRFKGSWQHGFNVMPTGQLDIIDPEGATAAARNEASISANLEPGVHYLMNNLPYALALEYGHSSQAPSGVVQLTAIEFTDIVDVAVQGLKK